MTLRDRLIPVIVASPLFLQNLDTSVMATALPSIARSLNVQPLHLNLAITSYLLSIAVFLPVSAWLAERFGAKRVFCAAIIFFSLGSTLCGAAQTLHELVVFRLLQGMGGAMMVPVGRLILLRSVPAERMVAAMVWFTVPPTFGRMIGPLVGGAIVTLTSWRWIFLINVPFGVLGVLLAWWFVPDTHERGEPEPFDVFGFVLMALGLTGVLGALETAGKGLFAPAITWAAFAIGVIALLAYWLRSRKIESPIIDLRVLRFPTFRASIIGGTPLRVAIGASPFLLPLMLQLGFGLSPLNSGLLTMATAIGSLATRTIMTRAIRKFGFRKLLMAATTLTSLFYASYSLFTPETPHAAIFVTLLFGGLVNSMAMVCMATLGFAEIPKPRMGHATALNSMSQQLSLSFGVVLAATLVSAAAWWHGGSAEHLTAHDFSPAFIFIGLMTMISLLFFVKLDKDEGANMR